MGEVGGVHKGGCGGQFVGERFVPDAPRFFPGKAAEFARDHVKGVIGNAGVDVYPAVVLEGVDVIFHVGGLRVLAEDGVVVRRAGRFHRTDARAVDVGGEQTGADDPVCLVGGLPLLILPDQRAEDIGHGFVQCTGLVGVVEIGFILGDAVCEFVPDHVERFGEAVEEALFGRQVFVAVAVDHLRAVPKGVVVSFQVVDGGVEFESAVVYGVAPVDVEEHVVGDSAPVVGFVDGGVAGGWLSLCADFCAGKLRSSLGVVDGALFAGGRLGGERGSQGGAQSDSFSTYFGRGGKRSLREFALLSAAVAGDLFEQVRRRDAENGMTITHGFSFCEGDKRVLSVYASKKAISTVNSPAY